MADHKVIPPRVLWRLQLDTKVQMVVLTFSKELAEQVAALAKVPVAGLPFRKWECEPAWLLSVVVV